MLDGECGYQDPRAAADAADGAAAAVGALAASGETVFRRLLETLPAGAYTCDVDGLITYYNHAAVETWGRAPKLNDPVDRFCGSFKLYSAQGSPIRHDQCWMALALTERRKYNRQEIIVERPDGERRTVLAHANPLHDDAGNLIGAVNVLVDITGRKQVEQQLKALNETLEQRVQQRTVQLRSLAGELTRAEERERRRLAQVLHDHLQQLLVAAKLRTELLRSQSGDERTREAASELHGLLDQTIKASRSLTFELSPPILYENGLIAAIEWLARWMQERHGMTVHLHADDDAEPAEEQVRILLFQSARELLFNVVKHAKAAEAWVRVSRDGGRVCMAVEDRGSGFDSTAAAGGEEQGPLAGGMGGFGLFSIRERLSLINGQMKIGDRSGGGACVTLWAPLHAPQPAAGAARREAPQNAAPVQPPPRGPRGERIRVLVADDHTILRDGLALLLSNQPDMELIGQAADGQLAVELAARLRPDVVVMDVNMPQLNGVAATSRIKAATPDVQVVALSLHEEQTMAAAMRQAGASAYLTKGGPGTELIRVIRSVAHAACNGSCTKAADAEGAANLAV